MKRNLVILAVACMAVATPALAQGAVSPEKAKEMFDKIDTNHDGVLSLDEWKAAGRRERGFNFIDADHDGKVTPAELMAAAARFGH